MSGGLDRKSWRKCFPQEGMTYSLSDLIEVLGHEIDVRELIDMSPFGPIWDFKAIHSGLQGMELGSFCAFFKGDCQRLVIKRCSDIDYEIVGIFGVPPRNDRAICSDRSAGGEGFGLGFAALGGNSLPSPQVDSVGPTIESIRSMFKL